MKITVNQLTTKLETVVKTYGHFHIKESIGDSTNNNRVATVSQLLRFLRSSPVRSERTLGRVTRIVFPIMVNEDLKVVRSWNRRTDAYDTSEFLDGLNYAKNVRSLKNKLQRAISNA